ncbi:hypothetical protein BURPS305_1071 [Burkholderia pseudomallei 305]|nr:hypothetical protein BURPS305_1071 [Burkholderia pseudomallei 305]
MRILLRIPNDHAARGASPCRSFSGACGNGRNARTRAWAARRSSRPCAQFG